MALSLNRRVGVDVQSMDYAALEPLPLEAICHPLEHFGDWNRETCIQVWSMKEALLKACGTGLFVPMTDILLKQSGNYWSGELANDCWYIVQSQLSDESSLAVCTDYPCRIAILILPSEPTPA